MKHAIKESENKRLARCLTFSQRLGSVLASSRKRCIPLNNASRKLWT